MEADRPPAWWAVCCSFEKEWGKLQKSCKMHLTLHFAVKIRVYNFCRHKNFKLCIFSVENVYIQKFEMKFVQIIPS
jgi:hypothetical protein